MAKKETIKCLRTKLKGPLKKNFPLLKNNIVLQ